jgi:hypothetical protein
VINKQTIAYPFSSGDLQMKADYVSGTNPIYIGHARPGSLSSAAEWQLKKITYDGSNNVTAIQFAAGVNDYSKIWDDRASYTYA